MRLRLSLLAMLLATAAQAQPAPPNFIFIETDDQSLDHFASMPKVAGLLSSARRFNAYYPSQPVCGPSRASMLTGMYPHNTGIVSNDDTYNKFTTNGLHAKTWAKALQDGGYYTAQIGKVHGYPVNSLDIPEGWDRWWVFYNQQLYNNYDVNDQGVVRTYGAGDTNYVTEQMRIRAVEVITSQVAAGKPFAINLEFSCPHTPSTPSSYYNGTAGTAVLPYKTRPNYNPATMPGKPSFMQAMPVLPTSGPGSTASADMFYRKGIECLRSVDDAVYKLMNRLEIEGVKDNTFVFFKTDNPYCRGEFRLVGKGNTYCIRSPLYVWGPGIVPGEVRRGIIGNTDLMPTALELAGLPIPAWVDGRSIVPLFTTDSLTNWRKGYLVRGIGDLTMNDVWTDTPHVRFFTYLTTQYQYNYYLTSPRERELYYWQDVYQMTNLAPSQSAGFVADLDQKLQDLSTCAGASCRAAEDSAPLAIESLRLRTR